MMDVSIKSLFARPAHFYEHRWRPLVHIPCRFYNSFSSAITCDDDSLFRYTSGRWLWDEKNQLANRYKRFNVDKLKRIAAECAGARKCKAIVKLSEGGFNKVFRLVMDNGHVLIARIPQTTHELSARAIASEVASMAFARTCLGIQVPKVVSWSGTANTLVESEYILMEEANGRQLSEVWTGMEIEDKAKVVEDLVKLEQKLLCAALTKYGNLYFAENAFPGCVEARLLPGSTLSQSIQDEIGRRFVIGPVIDKTFWQGERAAMNIDRGPWDQAASYIKAIARREIAWIAQFATSPPQHSTPDVSDSSQNWPEAHIALYKKLLAVAEYLPPADSCLSHPVLWHWDLHAPNIFVQGNNVTSIIDWQDSWFGPLFLQARRPRLVDYNGKIMLRFPEGYDSLNEEDKAEVKCQVEKSVILACYEIDATAKSSLMKQLFHTNHMRTRIDTMSHAHNTWEGDIIPLRQCLIRIARNWNDFNDQIPCPISFSEEELKQHAIEGESWNERADFWDLISDLVSRDGWTRHEDYDAALELFRGLEKKGMGRLNLMKQTTWAARQGSDVK